MAIVGNLQVFRGEDKVFLDEIYDASGLPQNVQGWSATFQVYNYWDPDTTYFVKTVGAGISLANPTAVPPVAYNWALSTLISRADTLPMLQGVYSYRYTRTDAGANTVVTIGLLTISP